MFAFWNGHYFVTGAVFAFGLGYSLLLVPLVFIALARVEEIAAVAFGRKPRRLIAGPLPAPAECPEGIDPYPGLPGAAGHAQGDARCRRPPAILRISNASWSSITRPIPACWLPIEEHCRTLGERFKFVNADNLAGFKAGALRLALAHTAPDASIIGIIDADYVVHPDWLNDSVRRSRIRRSALCRRRRTIATAIAPSCIMP